MIANWKNVAVSSALKMSLSAALVAGLMSGCSSSSESAGVDTLTANVGRYDPAPSNAPKPRVGVPPFNVQAGKGFSGGQDLNDYAADQMTTLLDLSERFTVIERAQMQKLLDEQNLEGIVTPDELAKSGKVRGVDYLLLGKVTNLRLKDETTSKGFGLAQVGGGLLNFGGGDYKKKERTITAECGVDIRLVDPVTGEVVISNFSEFKRTDSTSAMGIDILGASAEADAEIEISEDDKGKILRLALDDALRKSLPKVDKFVKSGKVKASGAAAPAAAVPAAAVTPAAGSGVVPSDKGDRTESAAPAAAKKFCPECGTAVAGDAKFCPKDGAKIQ